MNDKQQLKKVELRELQPILRRAFDNRLIVVRYTTKQLLPPGENYGSSILSVHVVIKRHDKANEEDLHLVAKMPPPTEFQWKVFNTPLTFRKEIWMYESVLSSYNQLEREAGLKEDELFDILPKYYQSRLSLNPQADFDDDAVILMENLNTRDYYTSDRTEGHDLEHSRIAIKAMARFHALGMAIKYKKPEYFKVLKKRSEPIEGYFPNTDNWLQKMVDKMMEDPDIAAHIDRCRTNLETMLPKFRTAVSVEPWSTIIHTDFWVNNIMFHRSEDGRVDDVKFVDFQNYRFFSPLRELVFYLFSSTNDEVQDNNIDELIDLYHETLLIVLTRMGCETQLFARDKFDMQLPVDAKIEFVHLCFMLKILTLDTQDTKDYEIKDVFMSYQGNQALLRRLRKIVLYFVERNWL